MNAVQQDNTTTIIGEIANEDTVPGFVSVGATLTGKNGRCSAKRPASTRSRTPCCRKKFRRSASTFPKVKLADVKSVRMQPNSMLVPASADPVIGVCSSESRPMRAADMCSKGELLNESGETVNIPHVLATYYDNSGKVIWVSDGYVDKALLPQTPVPFAVALRDDMAANVHNYRVTVNQIHVMNTAARTAVHDRTSEQICTYGKKFVLGAAASRVSLWHAESCAD